MNHMDVLREEGRIDQAAREEDQEEMAAREEDQEEMAARRRQCCASFIRCPYFGCQIK